MDDEDLPLSSPLPLSPPAVQALIDTHDAPPSSESTGGDDDVDMEESDSGQSLERGQHMAWVCCGGQLVVGSGMEWRCAAWSWPLSNLFAY